MIPISEHGETGQSLHTCGALDSQKAACLYGLTDATNGKAQLCAQPSGTVPEGAVPRILYRHPPASGTEMYGAECGPASSVAVDLAGRSEPYSVPTDFALFFSCAPWKMARQGPYPIPCSRKAYKKLAPFRAALMEKGKEKIRRSVFRYPTERSSIRAGQYGT